MSEHSSLVRIRERILDLDLDAGLESYLMAAARVLLEETDARPSAIARRFSGAARAVVILVPRDETRLDIALRQTTRRDSVLVGPGVYAGTFVVPSGVHVESVLGERGGKVRAIRARQTTRHLHDLAEVALDALEYEVSSGQEVFLQGVTPDDELPEVDSLRNCTVEREQIGFEPG